MSFPNVFESTQPFSKQPPGIIGGHECWDSLPWPLVHSVQGGHRHRWEIRHGSKVRQWGKVGLTWSGILKLPQFFWGGICSETLKFSGSYKESSKPFAGFPSVVSRIWCSDTLEMTRGMFFMGILNPNKPCADATWRGLAWFRVSSMHKVQFVWDWVTCGLTKNRFQTPFQDPIHEQIYLLSVYMHIYIYIYIFKSYILMGPEATCYSASFRWPAELDAKWSEVLILSRQIMLFFDMNGPWAFGSLTQGTQVGLMHSHRSGRTEMLNMPVMIHNHSPWFIMIHVLNLTFILSCAYFKGHLKSFSQTLF